MKILAIETSCDETGAAVLEKSNGSINVLSNVTATSIALHAATGGIIPENAAREQVKMIIPVITEALLESNNNLAVKQSSNISDKKTEYYVSGEKLETAKAILEKDIDAIAVTHGPGLIGSLLVGVETAKTLSFVFKKPLIPINHLLAHIFANFISTPKIYNLKPITFPFIGLIVSGGHTDLLFFKSLNDYQWLGGTRDDAAGEALDKIGRLLNLSYPAGPEIEERAKKGQKTKIEFHSPLLHEDTFDFSFSGLKTEVMRFVHKTNEAGGASGEATSSARNKVRTSDGGSKRQDPLSEDIKNEICFATQKAAIDVLVKKTLKAAEQYGAKTILLGGGVSANHTLLNSFKSSIINSNLSMQIHAPKREFTTDNAAMIGAYALLDYKPVDRHNIHSTPDLYFD